MQTIRSDDQKVNGDGAKPTPAATPATTSGEQARVDLPAPPFDSDVDPAGFPAMLITPAEILRDHAWIAASDAEYRAATNLYFSSWELRPFACLPADDRSLARLCGLGLTEWIEVKSVALAGWYLASDHRLYHPRIADKAKAVIEAKSKNLNRTTAATSARQAQRRAANDDQRDVERDEVRHVDRDVGRNEVQIIKEGRNQSNNHQTESVRKVDSSSARDDGSLSDDGYSVDGFHASRKLMGVLHDAYPDINIKSVIADNAQYVVGKNPDSREKQEIHMKRILNIRNCAAVEMKVKAKAEAEAKANAPKSKPPLV